MPGRSRRKPVITAHLVADVEVDGDRWPVYVHTIDHPSGRILVDTGMVESHPDVEEDWHPRCYPERIPRNVACVINTHLHFDHCGGNVLFAGIPIHVQRRELADARTLDDYTVRDWVDPPGVTYVEHDGEVELVPGIRLIPTPGHTDGHQSVLVDGTELVGGDVAYSFRALGDADTPGKLRVLELAVPTWLAHAEHPRVPLRNS
jgi:N-acyl homoserine lactone hydrolase